MNASPLSGGSWSHYCSVLDILMMRPPGCGCGCWCLWEVNGEMETPCWRTRYIISTVYGWRPGGWAVEKPSRSFTTTSTLTIKNLLRQAFKLKDLSILAFKLPVVPIGYDLVAKCPNLASTL